MTFSLVKWATWHKENYGWSDDTIATVLMFSRIAEYDGFTKVAIEMCGLICMSEWCIDTEEK